MDPSPRPPSLSLSPPLAVALALAACGSRPADGPSPDGEPLVVAPPSAPSATASAPRATTSAAPPEEEGELRAGRRRFRGMVRPTKDGYEVRGVIVEGSALPDALAKSAMDGIPSDSQWFLGAVVRVTGEIVAHEHEERSAGGIVQQERSGSWLTVRHIETVELVARAETVEGVLQRSKGFFEVGKYLVRRDDLGWSLAGTGGGKEGDRVKLWGQPRIVHCHPDAQCLEGGSLPIFDVGRAEKLP